MCLDGKKKLQHVVFHSVNDWSEYVLGLRRYKFEIDTNAKGTVRSKGSPKCDVLYMTPTCVDGYFEAVATSRAGLYILHVR